MKVLFLTLLDFKSYREHNIYCDLLREFIQNSHEVYCISPSEKRTGVDTHFEEDGYLLKLKIGNTQKTNIFEKGISTMLIEQQFTVAIKKYFSKIRFDLIIYSTPPITLYKAVEFVKKRDGAKCYLLLKDIFPQNAVDLGILTKSGFKGLIYKYFRSQEKKLYAISDRIGCMSQANVDYIVKHNPQVDPDLVEICPNTIEVQNFRITDKEKVEIRKEYGIPNDRKVFVYGGNLGKPQGVPFIIDCLRTEKENKQAFFLIIGDGTEFSKLEQFVSEEQPVNVKLMKRLPKAEYDRMIAACDIGMIFLDHRFTIPNFPSRLLSYMQAGIPVIACTDSNTDIGEVITEGDFGWWCESDTSAHFTETVRKALDSDILEMGRNAFRYLKNHYTVHINYKKIIESIEQ